MNDIVITRCLYIDHYDHYLIKIILTRRCPAQWTWLGGNSEFARYMMVMMMKVSQLDTGQSDNNTALYLSDCCSEVVEVVVKVVVEVVVEVVEVVV